MHTTPQLSKFFCHGILNVKLNEDKICPHENIIFNVEPIAGIFELAANQLVKSHPVLLRYSCISSAIDVAFWTSNSRCCYCYCWYHHYYYCYCCYYCYPWCIFHLPHLLPPFLFFSVLMQNQMMRSPLIDVKLLFKNQLLRCPRTAFQVVKIVC